jgi:hypothetical protein
MKKKQGKGSSKVGANFHIYDELPTMKVKQISQGEGSMKAKVDLKHTN